METKTIEFNGIEVTCCVDGSVSWWHQRYNKVHRTNGSDINGYRKVLIGKKGIFVHRLIAMAFLDDFSDDLQVNHINGDKSDNRIDNIEMATHGQNQRAFRTRSEDQGYRGVNELPSGRYRASIMNGGKKLHCAVCDTPKEAALARDASAHHAGYSLAGLNFPWIFSITPSVS